jgi:hypothetical protein
LSLLCRVVLFLLVASWLSPPCFAQQYAANYVYALKQAQEKRLEADKKLVDFMESLADWLVQFRLKFGHWPEVGVEQDRATKFVREKLLKPNPYCLTGVLSAEESKVSCPVRFVQDQTICDDRRLEWEKTPPSLWKGEPGTITVIYDQYDNIVLWGAGAEHLPVQDCKNNKTFLTWRSFTQ